MKSNVSLRALLETPSLNIGHFMSSSRPRFGLLSEFAPRCLPGSTSFHNLRVEMCAIFCSCSLKIPCIKVIPGRQTLKKLEGIDHGRHRDKIVLGYFANSDLFRKGLISQFGV